MASSFVGMPPLVVGLTLCGRALFGKVLDKNVYDGGLSQNCSMDFRLKFLERRLIFVSSCSMQFRVGVIKIHRINGKWKCEDCREARRILVIERQEIHVKIIVKSQICIVFLMK